MRDMPSSELVSLISFLAALLIFFSIDMKARERRNIKSTRAKLFERTSRAGGITTSIALALAWVDMFLPDESRTIHVIMVAGPGTIAVTCAIALGIELLFEHETPEGE